MRSKPGDGGRTAAPVERKRLQHPPRFLATTGSSALLAWTQQVRRTPSASRACSGGGVHVPWIDTGCARCLWTPDRRHECRRGCCGLQAILPVRGVIDRPLCQELLDGARGLASPDPGVVVDRGRPPAGTMPSQAMRWSGLQDHAPALADIVKLLRILPPSARLFSARLHSRTAATHLPGPTDQRISDTGRP